MSCNLFLKIAVTSKAKCIYITTLLLLKSSALELVASNKTYDTDETQVAHDTNDNFYWLTNLVRSWNHLRFLTETLVKRFSRKKDTFILHLSTSSVDVIF